MERSLRQDMRVAYATIFDRAFSNGELDDVLRMDLNGNSAGHRRFFRDVWSRLMDGTGDPEDVGRKSGEPDTAAADYAPPTKPSPAGFHPTIYPGGQ